MEINPEIPTVPVEAPRKPLYNKFLEAGREGKNDWWRYIVGIAISFVGYFIASAPIFVVMTSALLKKGVNQNDPLIREKVTNPEFLGLDPNVLLILLLLSFVGGMAGLWVAVRFLHQKRFISIITSASRIRWKRVWFAAGLWLIASFALLYIGYLENPTNFRLSFEPVSFSITLLIALLFLPAQTWWEEFMMRGYLLQGIGLLTRKAWIPVVITSVMFGLLHAGNPEVAKLGLLQAMPLYILPGLFFGLITVLDEGLEIPMGLHFANNLFGTIIITNDTSAIQASTILRQNSVDPFFDTISLILFPIFLLLFWWIYKWNFQKLYR